MSESNTDEIELIYGFNAESDKDALQMTGRIVKVMWTGHNDYPEFIFQRDDGKKFEFVREGDVTRYVEGLRAQIEYTEDSSNSNSIVNANDEPSITATASKIWIEKSDKRNLDMGHPVPTEFKRVPLKIVASLLFLYSGYLYALAFILLCTDAFYERHNGIGPVVVRLVIIAGVAACTVYAFRCTSAKRWSITKKSVPLSLAFFGMYIFIIVAIIMLDGLFLF